MIAFALACFLLIVTPGPGVLSVAGAGSGFGFKKGRNYLWGLCIGNFLVGVFVATGIAAAVFSVRYLREVLMILSLSYMLYIAFKVAFAGSKIGFINSKEAPLLKDGIMLQLINPKAYVANTVLFSGFDLMLSSLFHEVLIKFIIWNVVWIPMHFAWLLAGVTLKRLNLSPKIQRGINMFMAVSMVSLMFLSLFSSPIEL